MIWNKWSRVPDFVPVGHRRDEWVFVGCAVKEIVRIAIIIRVFVLSLTYLTYRDVITVGHGELVRIACGTEPTLELLALLL